MSTGQLNWRAHHSSILLRNKIYCWGGNQKDLPLVHDGDDKRKVTSTVDVFELSTFKWERKSTTSNPPAGVFSYACTSIKDSALYFGGSCKPLDCFHNNLYKLNTLTLNWNEIISTTTDNIPMRKYGCGMISFNMNGEDHLFLSGGIGPTPLTKQTHAQYIPSPANPHLSYTNEIHCMNVTTSPGQWIVPVITGTRPPPLAYFTINTLPGNRGVIFGGLTINERNRFYRTNDLYIFTYSHNTIDFKKIVPSDTIKKWPKGRSEHATSIINSISSNGQLTSHLITIGGLDDYAQQLNDSWILDISSLIWYQINLPECVTKRYGHSITAYHISNNRVWIIINGGASERIQSRNTHILVTGCDVTNIVELEYSDDEWILKRIWDSEQYWYKTRDVIIREKEAEKWSTDMRKKDMKLTLLQSSESSFKYTVDMLNKQLQESHKLLEIQKTISLAKSQELDDSKKRIILLKKTLTHTSTITSDEEIIEVMEGNKKTDEIETIKEELPKPIDEDKPDMTSHDEIQLLKEDEEDMEIMEGNKETEETEPLEEEKSNPVDDDKSDKTLILQDENESLQMMVASKNEQVEELQSMLETKDERMKELESIQEQVMTLQSTITNKSSQVEELQSMLEIERDQMKQLKVQMEEFKKIEELRMSSSHDSEVIKYHRDAAVQFSYMIPVTDHLDGVHVAGETLFLIQGDKPQSLNWEEYGFRLHFPQGAISPSDTCEVVVKALVGGKFQFPEGTELVSAVYAVAFAKKLLEPVEMEIQHCVLLTNDEQGKSLSFVSTAKNLRDNPNKFEFVEGGVFYPSKRYASIQRKHYCENAIVEKTTPPAPPSPPPSTTPPPHPPPPPPHSDGNESSGDDDIVKAKPHEKNKRCYTGQIYYERKGYNKWQMKFIVVRDIDAFVKYISTTYPNCEEDQVIRFTFLDPVDGYIELVLEDMDQVTSQGWKIEPHMEPLILMKRDVDLYGSQDIKLPPSCLLTVWTESSLNPETRLSHALPLSGIDCMTRKIYVRRFLDKADPSSISESTSHIPMTVQIRDTTLQTYTTSNTDTDRSTVDTKQVIRCIKQLMQTYHPDISELFEGVLKTVSSEMYGAGLIPHAVEKNPTFDGIMSSFLSGFAFKDELQEIEEHCVKFLNVFYKIGGPFVYAANKIKKSIQDTIIDKLGVQLNI